MLSLIALDWKLKEYVMARWWDFPGMFFIFVKTL